MLFNATNMTIKERKPISITTFKKSKIVECAYCKGTGINDDGVVCEKCDGTGELERVAEGNIKMYKLKI